MDEQHICKRQRTWLTDLGKLSPKMSMVWLGVSASLATVLDKALHFSPGVAMLMPGDVLQGPATVDLWSRPRCVSSAGWVAPDQHTGDTTDLVGEGLHRDNDKRIPAWILDVDW